MKTIILAIAATAMAASSLNAVAEQRDRRDQQTYSSYRADQGRNPHPGWGKDYRGGHQWKNGERIGYDDWNDATPINYRSHHLRHPPRGYEWRESNGQYVMAAVATGLIASIIINNRH